MQIFFKSRLAPALLPDESSQRKHDLKAQHGANALDSDYLTWKIPENRNEVQGSGHTITEMGRMKYQMGQYSPKVNEAVTQARSIYVSRNPRYCSFRAQHARNSVCSEALIH